MSYFYVLTQKLKNKKRGLIWLKVNLSKNMEDLYKGFCQLLLKHIIEELRNLRDISELLCIRRVAVIKMSIILYTIRTITNEFT